MLSAFPYSYAHSHEHVAQYRPEGISLKYGTAWTRTEEGID